LSYSFGINSSGDTGFGGGGGSGGRVTFSGLTFTKAMDVASIPLLSAAAARNRFRFANLSYVPEGQNNPRDLFQMRMTDVQILSVNALQGPESVIPRETVGMSFATVTWTFSPQDADGTPGTVVQAGWDLRAGRPLP
jgi:type VI protein secretion system component Hcp